MNYKKYKILKFLNNYSNLRNIDLGTSVYMDRCDEFVKKINELSVFNIYNKDGSGEAFSNNLYYGLTSTNILLEQCSDSSFYVYKNAWKGLCLTVIENDRKLEKNNSDIIKNILYPYIPLNSNICVYLLEKDTMEEKHFDEYYFSRIE